jgi:protein SERAC1
LTGGQITTWTAEGAKAPWPKLLLSEDIPEARISAFGYDADVVKFLGQTSQNKIRQHANNLLSNLADTRFNSNTVIAISCKLNDLDAMLMNRRQSSR